MVGAMFFERRMRTLSRDLAATIVGVSVLELDAISLRLAEILIVISRELWRSSALIVSAVQ